MADKRPGNVFNYVQPRRKIPKLDVSIVASGSVPLAQREPFVRPLGRGAAAPPPTSSHRVTSAAQDANAMSEDMWGDDDVELIMLASQVILFIVFQNKL